MDDIVQALIDHHAKQGRKIRIISVKRGKGFAAHDVLIPGRLEIDFEVIEGDEPPSETGIITSGAGEPVTILPKQ